MSNKDNYYVDNKEIHQLFVAHKKKVEAALEAGEEMPRACDGIGQFFIDISKGVCSRANFVNYPFKEDMILDGIENCVMALNNYDPDKFDRPYAYFTKVVWWSNLRKIEREHKQLYVKFKSLQNAVLENTLVEGEDENFQYDDVTLDNDKMTPIINKFEKKKSPKKKGK